MLDPYSRHGSQYFLLQREGPLGQIFKDSSLFIPQRDTICFVQEHKLRLNKLPLLGRSVWKDGHFFIAMAQDSVHTARNDVVTVGKGT